MTEDEVHVDVAPAGGDGAAASFGARLAAAREKEGLSVGDVAARLRLHVNQVRALESGNLAKLPEAAYVRGFVRSYARALGLDPAPLIDDLNTRIGPAGDSVVDGMARTRDYSPVRAAAHERTSRSLVLGLSLVALVALGAVGWYATRDRNTTPVAAPAAVAPVPQDTPAPATPDAAAPVDSGAAGAAGDSASAPVAEPAPAPSQPFSEAGALLLMSFSGSSWVEVTDAAGKVLVSQTAGAGEVLQPVGTPPLNVVIGDASKVTVKVRGEPYNLDAATRANIARFSVR